VLAQVNAAISPLVQALSGEGDGDFPASTGKKVTESSKDVQEVADLGVAISRSEIEQHVSGLGDKPKVRQSVKDRSPKPRELKAEDISEEGSSAVRKLEEKPRKSKKSRDEFDSLFDSLEAKKPAKKKKRKKGDEFDSLFSSLV
jgi:ribonuclease MRP protein subunit RMP1